MSQEFIENLFEEYKGLSVEELAVAKNNAIASVMTARTVLKGARINPEVSDLESLPLGEERMLLADFYRSLASLAAIKKAISSKSAAVVR